VIVAAFAEKSMMNDTMDIQLIEKRITVLDRKSAVMWRGKGKKKKRGGDLQSPSIQKQ